MVGTGPFFVRGRTVDSELRGGGVGSLLLAVFTHKKGKGSFRHVQCPFNICAIFNNLAPELEEQMSFNLPN